MRNAIPIMWWSALLLGVAVLAAPAQASDPAWSTSLRDETGAPVPYLGDEAILDFLRRAEVRELTEIGRGTTKPLKVRLDLAGRHGWAVFRSVNEFRRESPVPTSALFFRDSYSYEAAAYEVSRFLGFHRVPPTVLRPVDGVKGSLQIWIDDVIMNVDRRDRGLSPPNSRYWWQQEQLLRLFDNIAGNLDRNLGNLLIDGSWTMWFIDHTRCFAAVSRPLNPGDVTSCERELWRTMRGLTPKQLEAHMKPFLERAERSHLARRFEFMVDHLQRRIDRLGADEVLFEMLPAPQLAENWGHGLGSAESAAAVPVR